MRNYDKERRQHFLMRTRDKKVIAAAKQIQKAEEKRVGYPLDRQDVVDQLIRLGASVYWTKSPQTTAARTRSRG